VSALAFDYSGVYLGIGCGEQAEVKVVKEWAASAAMPHAHAATITGIAWGEHASKLVTSSLDSTVRIFSPKK
jgi:hypothetical protein